MAGATTRSSTLQIFATVPTSPTRRRAALELAERVTRDPHEVDDAFWAELRKYYDEGEIIELLAAIGLFNYFNRFNDALRMEPTK